MKTYWVNLYKYVTAHNYSQYGKVFADWELWETKEDAEKHQFHTPMRVYIGTFPLENVEPGSWMPE